MIPDRHLETANHSDVPVVMQEYARAAMGVQITRNKVFLAPVPAEIRAGPGNLHRTISGVSA